MKYSGILFIVLFLTITSTAQKNLSKNYIQFIFTSDAHYGFKRKKFRKDTAVDGHTVNAAMIQEMNKLPMMRLPLDGGVNEGKLTGPIDYVIEGGDIANRMEFPIQSDAASWRQFYADYINGITLKNHSGNAAELYIVPGNHDISNAIGFYRPMRPKIDATSMVSIYNQMMKPLVNLTTGSYNYEKDKIHYSKNIHGMHFVFITLWPDSSERVWMDKDLQTVSAKTPVILFTHDQPECEAKHFSNPNMIHGINAKDRFENLLDEVYKDGLTALSDGGKTDEEQIGWVNFLKRHPNIKAYFHGNDNFNQYYSYRGTDGTISLPVFRVDSPMKGKYSSTDETRLSFQVITINAKTLTMTVRECLWNTDPSHPEKSIQWGASKTLTLN